MLWRLLLALLSTRLTILVIALLAMAAFYILYRKVFLPGGRSGPKGVEAIMPTLECLGVFDERVLTVNQTTVIYQPTRKFAQHFAAARSQDDFERMKAAVFQSIEDKLREAVARNAHADLSQYESTFGITILSVTP